MMVAHNSKYLMYLSLCVMCLIAAVYFLSQLPVPEKYTLSKYFP